MLNLDAGAPGEDDFNIDFNGYVRYYNEVLLAKLDLLSSSYII